MKRKKNSNQIFAYTTIGLQLGMMMSVFVYGGYQLDHYLHSDPWFVVLGAAVGLGGGLYNLIKGLNQIERISEKSSKKQEDNYKKKWL